MQANVYAFVYRSEEKCDEMMLQIRNAPREEEVER